MKRKITIVGALLLCAILLTAASYFIVQDECQWDAHGFPFGYYFFEKANYSQNISDFQVTNNNGASFELGPCHMDYNSYWYLVFLFVLDVVFWMVVLSILFWIIQKVRRKPGSPHSSSGQPGDQSIDTSRDRQ